MQKEKLLVLLSTTTTTATIALYNIITIRGNYIINDERLFTYEAHRYRFFLPISF